MLRIKKLDIFIAKQFGLLFVGTFFICQFVLMMQFLWRYIDELIGKGLSMEVLAQFFWYMSLMLVPQALPLAILLSSLITFGNLGESSELTAIKAAGISLMQTFRSLIFITVVVMGCSFYFQNNIGPQANMKITQLLISMKQKSPELEIPEGIFYDGIPNCNLYVQKKNVKTGKLYGIMIYRMTNSYEDAAIILADSGMLQSTAEKKHLVLTLWSGEWFENMQSQELGNSASVPYRRETFSSKKIVLDFDADFNMTDAASLSNNAKAKSLGRIKNDIDSLNHVYDSIGRVYYNDGQQIYYAKASISKADSLRVDRLLKNGKAENPDTLFNRLPADRKLAAVNSALSRVQGDMGDMDFKGMITGDGDRIIRQHEIEAINKFTLAFSCLAACGFSLRRKPPAGGFLLRLPFPQRSCTSAQRPVLRLLAGTCSAVPRKPHKPPTRARRRGAGWRSHLHLLHLLRFRHFRLRIGGNRVPLTILSLSHGHQLLLQQFFCRNRYLPSAFSGMRRHRCALPELPGVMGVQVNIAEGRHEMKTIFRAGFQHIFERLHRFSVLLCRKFFTIKFRRHFDLLFRVCSTPARRRNVRFCGFRRVRARLCRESRTNRRHGRDGAERAAGHSCISCVGASCSCKIS